MDKNKEYNDIKTLSKQILEAQDAYYNTDTPIMSDAEFDTLWNNLKRIDPNNELFRKVGSDSGSMFKKVKHIMPMGSQQKSTSHEEMESWARKYPRDHYVVEYKCDGSSIELQYENGEFKRAVTRGNGTIGDDVTENISKAKYLVKKMKDSSFTGGVRGEVVIFHDDFSKHFKGSANCRNAANGIMKRKDSDKANLLSIVVYDILCRDPGDLDLLAYGSTKDKFGFKTEEEKIKFLRDQGFRVVETRYMDSIDDISKWRDDLSVTRFQEVEYDIDGLVIKCPEVDLEDVKRVTPNKQIAYKFILSEQPTIVRDVEFSVSGKYRTPVAVCDPVFLCGTTVKRASLANFNLITKLGLKIGSKVMMVKRGEIIPKIERVIFTPPDATSVKIPEYCEYCKTKLIVSRTEIYCPNKECPETQIHRLIRWCSVNKIYGLGPALCENLYKEGIVHDIVDLYKLTLEDLMKSMSPKIAKKIYDNIQKSKVRIPITKVIAGYDMDGIGESLAEAIVEKFKPSSWDEISGGTVFTEYRSVDKEKAIPVSRFIGIPGVGPNISQQISERLSENIDDLIKLSKYLDIDWMNKIEGPTNVSFVSGKKFVFTGSLNSMTRDTAIRLLKENGGKISSTVTKDTDFVVSNNVNSASEKMQRALELGIDIINEQEFLNLVNGRY